MDTAVGAVVAVSMFRELGPVLTGLMVSGRVGAAMSAEIGTMKVTEQIDALRALGVYPIDYLVVPRVMAMMISMPLLVCECVGMGIVAGYIVGVGMMDIPGPVLPPLHGGIHRLSGYQDDSLQGVRFCTADSVHQLPPGIERKGRR